MSDPKTCFNTSYHFDENLRDVPDDRAGMISAARMLEGQLSLGETDPHVRIKTLGTLGVYLRILGDLDGAQTRLEEAVTLAAQTGDERAALVNTLRLAHVYQWQRRFEEADSLFAAVTDQCEHDPRFRQYLDFAYQHYGKSKFDQRLYAEAEALFKQALDIRLAKGDESLVESSSLAWQTARRRRDAPAHRHETRST
jgi:tetratricopeptide (TPR) repeat protein